jgi:hypothetical protein
MRSKRSGFWRNVALESGDFASVGFMKKKRLMERGFIG